MKMTNNTRPIARAALWLGALLLAAMASCGQGRGEVDSALGMLEDAIDAAPAYDHAHELQLAWLKADIAKSADKQELCGLYKRVAQLYQFYTADSALAYADSAIAAAREAGRDDYRVMAMLLKADVLSRSGLFMQAVGLLDSLPAPIDQRFAVEYYTNRYQTCQYISEYASSTEYERQYYGEKMRYCDSIMASADTSLFIRKTIALDLMIGDSLQLASAPGAVMRAVGGYEPGMREYSVLMSQLGYAYALLGREQEATVAYAKAAMSDIVGSIKENMAMRSLAELRFRDGDIERANELMSKSFEDANYYNARMRHKQSAALIPLINNAYSNMQRDRQMMMWWVVALLGALIVLAIVSFAFIRKQLHVASKRNSELQQAREDEVRARQLLADANDQLALSNMRLKEGSVARDAYLSHFIWFCSSTINAMESYRHRLYLLAKTKKTHELYNVLTSTKEIAEINSTFYAAFDEALLTMIPTFAEDLDALLEKPLARRGEGAGELLGTEQRIYALMRMGMTDNQKIAEFLHCSISTVYTYRSKTKAKAKNPERFELEVMNIGR